MKIQNNYAVSFLSPAVHYGQDSKGGGETTILMDTGNRSSSTIRKRFIALPTNTGNSSKRRGFFA